MSLLPDDVKTLAKLVARDAKASWRYGHAGQAQDVLHQNPDAVLAIIDLLHREANRKKPNDSMVNAYLYMLSTSLEGIRYQIDRGYAWATELVEQVKELLLGLAKGGIIRGTLLIAILNAFRQARLDAGPELSALAGDLAVGQVEPPPNVSPADLDRMLIAMAEETGGDEFALHAQIADFTQALPPEFRHSMVIHLAGASAELLRMTAALSILDPAAEVRRATCRMLEQIAGSAPTLIPPATLRRMIAVRNWLPEADRPFLDAAVKKARSRDVACASWPKRQVLDVSATAIDGSGAQSLFAIVKEGRRHRIGALLVRQGIGVLDAWSLPQLAKADLTRFITETSSQVFLIPVAPEYLDIVVQHYLGTGLANAAVPPVGMLDFVEAVGVEHWQPQAVTPDDLVRRMEGEAGPAASAAAEIERIVAGSRALLTRMPFLDSWFEDDAEADAIIRSAGRARKASKVALVLAKILEPRRRKWAEKLLWSALWAKLGTGQTLPWEPFFILGRDLLGERPLQDIPLMVAIAERTIEAAARRR